MTILIRLCLFAALPLLLGACGETAGRYLLESPTADQKLRVPVARIELRDVTLPDYASASEIMLQSEDGALFPVKGAIWADDPVRAVTLSLARNLDMLTTATAAGEPWPLDAYPDIRISTRIERMVARSDGQFELAGQYSIAAPEQAVRESINRFEILQPLSGDTPAAVAEATSAALLTLTQQMAARLRR
ncbi:membrane integrity-associated transporter subunit PqiC [Rhodobacteraceae bacterium F11138]|nr:membrane integrity-associated transporter subunit PqiC [Rhodobacteraceae bacterium F11138]